MSRELIQDGLGLQGDQVRAAGDLAGDWSKVLGGG